MSCEFNSIEKFWWSAKSHFNKRLLASAEEIKKEKFYELVMESVNVVPMDKVLRLCKSNRKFIATMLDKVVRP